MDKKLTKLNGITKDEFFDHIKCNNIIVRPARLIPFYKPGHENALTSVFLASVRLVKEFRRSIFSELNIPNGGEVLYYTEPSFKEFEKCRFDGMIVVIKSNKIVDVALLEMKNGDEDINKEQIERYIEVCKCLGVAKLLTVSNQYVDHPKQCPLHIKSTKKLERYHFSWSYILTIAHLLLFDNDKNIEDVDQVEIMKEAVAYFRNKKSGVLGFNKMKDGWKVFCEHVRKGATVDEKSTEVDDVVLSWHQEEKDMALMLSQKLGILVNAKNNKYKDNKKKRIADDKNFLIKNLCLESVLQIKNSVSDIFIIPRFDKRSTFFAITMIAPNEKTSKARANWLRKQLEKCSKKNKDDFDKIAGDISIDIYYKNSSKKERLSLSGFINKNDYDDRTIAKFKIVLNKDHQKDFSSPTKFVLQIEETLVVFYDLIVQHMKKVVPKAPRINSNTHSLQDQVEDDVSVPVDETIDTTEQSVSSDESVEEQAFSK